MEEGSSSLLFLSEDLSRSLSFSFSLSLSLSLSFLCLRLLLLRSLLRLRRFFFSFLCFLGGDLEPDLDFLLGGGESDLLGE